MEGRRKAMSFRLDGRTALITGGTQGVGAAIARNLAKAGCNLVLHGLDDDEHCALTVRECVELGAEVSTVFGDLSEPANRCVPEIVEAVRAKRADVSILVNNAGTCCDEAYLDMRFDLFTRTMNLNVATPYFLTQAFARDWIQRGIRGRVLFTGSINGELAEPVHTAYDTSKGAVRSMVRTLCVSLAPHGIRVNALAPGLVITPLTAPSLLGDKPFKEWMELHTPNGKVPDAESCGPAAVFLLSDEAAHIHGHTLMVDGGMSIWQQPNLPDVLRRAGSV